MDRFKVLVTKNIPYQWSNHRNSLEGGWTPYLEVPEQPEKYVLCFMWVKCWLLALSFHGWTRSFKCLRLLLKRPEKHLLQTHCYTNTEPLVWLTLQWGQFLNSSTRCYMNDSSCICSGFTTWSPHRWDNVHLNAGVTFLSLIRSTGWSFCCRTAKAVVDLVTVQTGKSTKYRHNYLFGLKIIFRTFFEHEVVPGHRHNNKGSSDRKTLVDQQ